MPAKKATKSKARTTRAKKAPAKASTRKHSTAKKAPRKRATKRVNKVEEPVKSMDMAVCRSCHALPVGSIELMSLLLVLVFSLTAVLVTSVHALALQQGEIDQLEAKHHQQI